MGLKRRLFMLASSFLFLLLASCSQVPEATPQTVVLANGEALRKDAMEYAKDQSVTIEEAVERLELQFDIGKFSAKLEANEPNTFGGLWIQHKPDYKVVVSMTSGAEKVADYALDTSFAELIEVRKVEKTLKQLGIEQLSGIAALKDLDIKVESGVNVYKNQAELYVLDKGKLNSALAINLRISLPKGIAVIETGGFSSPGAYSGRGGAPLTSCTAGYSVRDGNGLYGITTAGHCPPNPAAGTQSMRSYLLTYITQWYFGARDVQWHKNSNIAFKPEAYDSSSFSFRKIYDNGNRGDQAIGSYVCKFGKETDYTCGYLRDKMITASDIPSSTNTYMRLDNGSRILTKRGDSGGPVYVGHQAWGTTYGGYFTPGTTFYGDHLYMAINYLTDTGLVVLHAPRP